MAALGDNNTLKKALGLCNVEQHRCNCTSHLSASGESILHVEPEVFMVMVLMMGKMESLTAPLANSSCLNKLDLSGNCDATPGGWQS